MTASRQSSVETSVTPAEIAQFDAIASRWWDPNGPMRPLHRMNPMRIRWSDTRIRRRFPQTSGLRVLDIGCGAGLAAEALAQRGYDVLGVDAAADAIAAGRAHAAGKDLPLDYRIGAPEDLLGEGERFKVITALEVIEHVANPGDFVATLSRLLAPDGLLFLSTLNRTPRSFVVAKLGAEYLLRMLPIGTHDWKKFVTPAELGMFLRRTGLRLAEASGMTPAPMTASWRASRDLGVNYIAMAEKGGATGQAVGS